MHALFALHAVAPDMIRAAAQPDLHLLADLFVFALHDFTVRKVGGDRLELTGIGVQVIEDHVAGVRASRYDQIDLQPRADDVEHDVWKDEVVKRFFSLAVEARVGVFPERAVLQAVLWRGFGAVLRVIEHLVQFWVNDGHVVAL